jgi:hypothetical protein
VLTSARERAETPKIVVPPSVHHTCLRLTSPQIKREDVKRTEGRIAYVAYSDDVGAGIVVVAN